MGMLGPGEPLEIPPGEAPARIGAYRLLARLGVGGMGNVYLARSDRGRTVAVKLVRRELAEQEEFRARFRQEVRAARRVGGYWTAPVLDADTEAAVPWVATGYVAGPSLQQVVGHDHGALPERSVRILAAGLAHALKDIHAAGIVHRDLKPSNVLVTIDGPRVIDFGIARALESTTVGGEALTRTGSLVGSPGFMAPEQVRGDRITPACDVFCLGSVLVYAATGRLPFGAANSGGHALMFRIAQEEPDLTGVPEGIADLVRDCLRKEPAGRPSLDAILERTGAEDTVAGGRSRDPWLPGSLVAQLARHAVRLLEAEDPDGGGGGGADAGGGAGEGVGGGAGGFAGAGATGGARPPAGSVFPSAPPVREASSGAGGPGDGRSPSAAAGGAGVGRSPAAAAGGPSVGRSPSGAEGGAAVGPSSAGAAGGVGVGRSPAAGAGGPGDGPSWAGAAGPSPEHGAVGDGGAPPPAPAGVPAGDGSSRLQTAVAGPTPPPGVPPTPPPSAPYGYPQQHPQPVAAYGYPQGGPQPSYQPYGGGHPYGGGLGSTSPYGPPPYGTAQEPERRDGRSTALLVVIALVVALGAGGTVYALMKNGGDDGKGGGTAGAAPTVTSAPAAGGGSGAPSPAASAPSASAGDGAVPDAYLGTWETTLDNANGANTRRLTIHQGKVGDPVLTLVADGAAEGGGTYHCVFEAHLAERPTGQGPLEIGPSSVTTGEPASSCSPGAATEVTLLPDGRLKRAKQGGGESLTYSRR
ncbi:serine/threonine-protein kinase [Streptomyces sp. NPDC096012]|uniref:serine/threonine-protein kinase n=1 Tax=Streptomyces sp. NPDC096012 TaxID=3155684 RepID=UPI00336A46AE